MNGVEADQYRDQSDQVYHNTNWIQGNGGWIHSNNVLFYFMSSPFFDPTSENQQLLSQYGGTPLEMEIMGNKARMESNLRKRRGLSYVVAYDPLESRAMADGQPSNVWIIRKQIREQLDSESFKALAYYFIVNETIYQAPSVAGVLRYRMLNTTTALNKIFAEASQFPIFSASNGHSYVKPSQKTTTQTRTAGGRLSKEATPMPGTQTSTTDKVVGSAKEIDSDADSRVVYDALQMTLRYGKEYADEVPLLGEPGNFRFAKIKENASTVTQSALQKSGPKLETPSHSRAPSAAPASTIVSPVQTKAAEKSVPEPVNKPKRRKSRVGDVSP